MTELELLTTSGIVLGERETGPLHLGHYFGTLENRVHAGACDLMVLIADYQTIIDRDSPRSLPRDVERCWPKARAGQRDRRAHPAGGPRPDAARYSRGVLDR